MTRIVDISGMEVSADPTEVLVTYSLGSCLGVTVYDPVARVGGMAHCMLPLSKLDPEKARLKPAMFADSGVQSLLQAVYNLGAQRKRLVVKAAGCSRILDEKGLFNIGERNYTVFRKVLWKNDIFVAGEDVGGSISRTLYLDVEAGRTIVKSGGKETEI